MSSLNSRPLSAPAPGLDSPLRLPCGQVLPNRLMKAALSEGLGTLTHGPDIRLERLYTRWGAGGYGLVITGNVMVDRAHLGEPGNVVVDDDRDLEGLARWAKSTKDGGTPIWMQINHPGRQANPVAARTQPVAPSAIAPGVPGFRTPRALTAPEIGDILERYSATARIAETAGFDGVQIHGAHGYLVSQFLSPLANQRTDEWGGDPQRRVRFALEVVRRIRAAVSPGFAVGFKLNSADFQRGGFTEDESRWVIRQLAAEAVDLIEISGGSYDSQAMLGRPATASTRAREAYFLEYAASARIAAQDVPLAVTGGFRSHSAMSQAISTGDCDVVGLGRPAAVTPDTAAAVLTGRTLQLNSHIISLRLPALLARAAAAKALEGALDLQWHTDQLHLLGAGQHPDPARPAWRTAISAVQRNGFDAFRSKRQSQPRPAPGGPALRKFQIERAAGRYLANPAVRMLGRLGIHSPLATALETTGRTTKLPRQVPVAASFDDDGAWIISQHGTTSGWGHNIGANPQVRIRQGSQWRTGIAVFHPEDDVTARVRSFVSGPLRGALAAAVYRALQSTPVSVRITFTDRPVSPESTPPQ